MASGWAVRLLSAVASSMLLLPMFDAGSCPPGEPVHAFFAGEIDLGKGPEPCKPEMEDCHYSAKISSGPDASGTITVDWDDADPNVRQVAFSQVKSVSTGETCDGPKPKAGKVPPKAAKKQEAPQQQKAPPQAPPGAHDDNWVPPEIPCTILPRLHWEGSDPAWNKEAIASLRSEFNPDEVIDGFDWHVILRFNDADKCEAAFNALAKVLGQCKDTDQEKCHTHKYVKAVEYVGDEPEARRSSGRHHHDPKAHRKEEL